MDQTQKTIGQPVTRLKFCGFTRQEDVAQAIAVGADALGFVFYPKSRRYVSPQQARELTANLPPFVTTVALFVEPDPEFVQEVIEQMHPGLLQFHGDESPQMCQQFDWPYLKAFRVGAPGLETGSEIEQFCLQYPKASGWLFDSFTPAYGGSGHAFDQNLLTQVAQNPEARPLILSGGLQADTVGGLIEQLRPWAVDVSSGIEDSPGVKSAQKMQRFANAVHQASMRF